MTDSLIGRTIAEKYLVEAQLGEGGMGHVYLAEHVLMGRKVAVKVMHPAMARSPDAITRFHREAANASRINHPNVAAIYDFGDADGTLYLVMELIEGETLTALLNRLGPLPLVRAAGILEQAAGALAAAHHLGIVHRDLKPDNIMIARQIDGRDWVKVVDFGIAKSTAAERGSQTVTTVGVSIGTPEFMSPEQLAGERLDGRSDVYALGLVFYNMLTGALPYPAPTSKETLVRRLTAPPRSLRDSRPDVAWPAALEAAIARALAPEVDARYPSAIDFAREVASAVATVSGERTVLAPVTAAPVPALVPAPTTPIPASANPPRQPTRVLSSAAPAAAPAPARGVRWGRWAIALLLIAVLGVGGGLAWRASGGGVDRDLARVRRSLQRTTTMLAAGEPLRARAAYRQAQDAIVEFRRRHDDPAAWRQLDSLVATFRQRALGACVDARARVGDTETASQFPCEAPTAPRAPRRNLRRQQ